MEMKMYQGDKDDMKSKRNARFWTWINGPVKITVRPGHPMRWHQTTYHDEGYNFESHVWETDGETLYHFISEEGRDCDGRTERVCDLECYLDDLRAVNSHEDIDGIVVCVPDWQMVRHGLRDHTAEAAGY